MIVVQGWVRVHEGDVGKLRDAAHALVAATRKEPGNLAYAFAEDVNEPGLFHVVERWANEAAVANHMLTSSLAEFMPKLAAMRDVRLRIARYDAPGETVLMEV
ncbi:MAG TPA: putative quinol monooxygenase [Vitreimonas sp.]|uniref:putative quinol monooxygenase n=1 Tax=Vitreimonas sp. TaxID=3069702 RepID=UPI002D2DA8AD|nr:putative quinol monooxygenase [Vitreimonas sp.]HYD88181.1 putative quinol monooxygenase [Vitreimonas sp.]